MFNSSNPSGNFSRALEMRVGYWCVKIYITGFKIKRMLRATDLSLIYKAFSHKTLNSEGNGAYVVTMQSAKKENMLVAARSLTILS
jgi:hypothetical protein